MQSSNNSPKSLSKKRNRVDPSDPVKNTRSRSSQEAKLELDMKIKLERILNNKSVQDDYFTIHSSDLASDSNSSVSTIRANRSRSRNCYCSDTDATRSDDIVIFLDEDSFYSVKVNPFLQLNFPDNTTDAEGDGKINSYEKENDVDKEPATNIIDAILDVVAEESEKDTPPAAENSAVNTNEAGNPEENYIANNKPQIPHEAITEQTDEEEDKRVIVSVTSFDNNQSAVNVIDSALSAAVSVAETENNPTVDNSPAPNIIDEAESPDDNTIADNLSLEVNTTDEVVNAEDHLIAIPNEITTEQKKEEEEKQEEDKEEEKVVVTSQSAVYIIDSLLGAVTEAETEITTIIDNLLAANATDNVDVVEGNTSKDKKDLENIPVEKITSSSCSVEKITSVNTAYDVVVLEDDPSEIEDYDAAKDQPQSKSTDRVERAGLEIEEDNSLTANPPAVVNTTQDIPPKTLPVLTHSRKEDQNLTISNPSYKGKSRSNEHENEEVHSQIQPRTRIASKTKVRITTEDASVIDALEDLPDFLNTSISELTSSFISERMLKGGSNQTICFDVSSSSTSTTWMKLMQSSSSLSTPSLSSSSSYTLSSSPSYNYISFSEAYMRLNRLLKHGTRENRKAVGYDEYNRIRADNEIASSEEEFLSDLDDLDLTGWKPPESELRRQVGNILMKLNPLEYNYQATVNDMIYRYLKYINDERRISKVNGIAECVQQPVSLIKKTELLIKREIIDKKLDKRFYYSPNEPPSFSELADRRRFAIVRKYNKCQNDSVFCYNYFRSIQNYNRPISKLEQKIEELKREFDLIFA